MRLTRQNLRDWLEVVKPKFDETFGSRSCPIALFLNHISRGKKLHIVSKASYCGIGNFVWKKLPLWAQKFIELVDEKDFNSKKALTAKQVIKILDSVK